MKAQFSVAEAYAKGRGTKKDPAKAFEMHLKLAENGFGKSQYHVAYAYFEGEGVAKDEKQAYEWFVKGAKNDNAICQYYAGYCLENGIGVEKNEKQAIAWYKRAAELGHVLSRQIVERLTGEKVQFKPEESPFESYLRAAENGDDDAMFIVGRCYMDGVGVEADAEKAHMWLNKAVSKGNQAAKRMLAQQRKNQQSAE